MSRLNLALSVLSLLALNEAAAIPKRQVASPTAGLVNPQGLVALVPLQGATFIGVPVTYGQSNGSFVLTADTGSWYPFVNGVNCQNCAPNVGWYGGNQRTTINQWSPLQPNQTAGCNDPTQWCAGAGQWAPAFTDDWGHESVVWMYDMQTVGDMTSSNPVNFGVIQQEKVATLSADQSSGALGLAPAPGDQTAWYKNLDVAPQFSLGMTKNVWQNVSASPYARPATSSAHLTTHRGWLEFGSPAGSSKWQDWVVPGSTPQTTNVVYESWPPAYWTVNVTSISIGNNSFELLPNISTILDTGNYGIQLPAAGVNQLLADLPLIQQGDGGLFWPCQSAANGSMPDIDIKMPGTSGIVIDFAYASVPYGGNDAPTDQPYCTGISTTNDNSAAFGLPFMRSYITTFDSTSLTVSFQRRQG